ncbi:hypothetical protein H2O64_15855 [Kordia sp. YSTF-M3]|uniref:Lipoprotein n=1 Tax=Kordia aestuariivivens TaxID=2759037 RepID=A0ABR7QC61_9FLAO|nr:hypothetical protein [Kordia aestuariivivens]MBC8756151.1 hypothetical protein [Kordia aestuariivivens]
MNSLSTLRKPYLGFILSLLVLFSSCYNPNSNEELSFLTIEEFTEKHISLTNKIIEIYSKEDDINMEMLSKFPDKFDNVKEFTEFLQGANFSKSSEIAKIYLEIQNNTNNFVKDLVNLDQKEIISKINIEIHRQFDTKDLEETIAFTGKNGSCADAYIEARSRCARNYAIAVTAAGISAFFTIGIGTAIGTAAAITVMALCYDDASNDHTSCLENQ